MQHPAAEDKEDKQESVSASKAPATQASGADLFEDCSEAVVSPASKCKWTAHLDPDSGITYYYNSETKESSWERPADMVDP